MYYKYETKFKDPFAKKSLCYWLRSRPKGDEFIIESMKYRVKRLHLGERIKKLEAKLEVMVKDFNSTIIGMNGCGTILSATIISEIGDIETGVIRVR